MEFLPKPKEVKLLTGEHALCYDGRIVLDGRLLGNGDTYAKVLQQGIQKETGMQYDIGYGVPGRKETGAIVLGLDETRKSQQYVLQVTEEEYSDPGRRRSRRALRCADAVPDDARIRCTASCRADRG